MQRTDIEGVILASLQEKEQELDDEINRLSNLNDEDIIEIRRKRLEAMKSSHASKRADISNGHGSYSEIHDEKEFFNIAKKSSKMVCHFYRPSTWRCEIIDKHLTDLARKHTGTRFIKINAEKSPFLCDRLKIWCIPTMVLIKDGKTDHSIVGMDELGGEGFATHDLEEVFAAHGIIPSQEK